MRRPEFAHDGCGVEAMLVNCTFCVCALWPSRMRRTVSLEYDDNVVCYISDCIHPDLCGSALAPGGALSMSSGFMRTLGKMENDDIYAISESNLRIQWDNFPPARLNTMRYVLMKICVILYSSVELNVLTPTVKIIAILVTWIHFMMRSLMYYPNQVKKVIKQVPGKINVFTPGWNDHVKALYMAAALMERH